MGEGLAAVEAGVGEAEEADGAGVGAEDAGDDAAAPVLVARPHPGAAGPAAGLDGAAPEGVVVEVERGGGPEAAPAGGEEGGLGGLAGRQVGVDGGEQTVRQAADEVDLRG